MSAAPAARRHVDTGDIDLMATLGPTAILPGDPTVRLGADSYARATFTPDGPGTIVVQWVGGAPTSVECWGPGGEWLAERADRLLGCTDDVSSFVPAGEPLRTIWRHNAGFRLTRTGTVWHDLAAWVLQQRIRFTDAAQQWRSLVESLGAPAPGPVDLRLPPDPAELASRSYSDLHRHGIERTRAETLIRAARELPRYERSVDGSFADVEPRLSSLRGIGPWTRGGLAGVTWGEADAVVVGDVGIPSMVAWTLAGEPNADDSRMLELLDPCRPHRYRALQLIFIGGRTPPRRGPRWPTHRIHHR